MSSDNNSDCQIVDDRLPSAQECDSLCQKFADITMTDSALAMFFLQDRQWDLNRALNEFHSYCGNRLHASVATATPVPCRDSYSQSKKTSSGSEALLNTSTRRVRVLTWNIDGLSTAYLTQRTLSVVDIIKREQIDIAFLQEVVSASEAILIRCLTSDYSFIAGGKATEGVYYTAILVRKDVWVVGQYTTHPFHSSQMGRNLLQVEGAVRGVPVILMTAHLESTKSFAVERKKQLQASWDRMLHCLPSHTVLFGGDLNIRDHEVDELGGVPPGIEDAWTITGCREESRYTWDTFRNDNLGTEGRCRAKLRFDRLYLRPCQPRLLQKVVYVELVGLERLPNVLCFPSDHWGVLAHFDIA